MKKSSASGSGRAKKGAAGEQTVLPEAESTTYRTMGFSSEQGTPEPSAGAYPGKLPSRVMSRGGQRLRSSPSAGAPRTRRREPVDQCSAAAAAESHVCGNSARLS